MANIFKLTQGYAEKPKRNVYDLSFSNNITANFGTLYPVFCKEVNPGDSMKIDTSFGLRAQPMIFPIQTRMRADIHYFYVRNRTLWKDWMDFYGKTKEGLVHPYVDRPISDFKTKSIYDFLGIPTTILSDQEVSFNFPVNPYNIFNKQIDTSSSITNAIVTTANSSFSLLNSFSKIYRYRTNSSLPLFYNQSPTYLFPSFFSMVSNTEQPRYKSLAIPLSPVSYNEFPLDKLVNRSDVEFVFNNPVLPSDILNSDGFFATPSILISFFHMKSSQNNLDIYSREFYYSGYDFIKDNVSDSYITPVSPVDNGSFSLKGFVRYNAFSSYPATSSIDFSEYDVIVPVLVFKSDVFYKSYVIAGTFNVGPTYNLFPIFSQQVVDASTLSYLPWCGNNKQLKIDVLPYRAYEAIYNSFYRNVQNDPFKINGVAEYNKYVTNLDGGADAFPYKLYQRNWELDFLTSAVQSPQQGLAPLVGVTVNNANSTATFKFQSDALNGGQPITATASVSDDGDVIGLQYYDSELPQSNIDRLMQAINYGISINDIRQTNALQRWLEKNIRRGYRYRDQLLSHFGVSVSYNELLMPEFIGGVSQDVETQTIFQTVTNENGYLGDYAGRGSVVGQSRNSVSKYCDEAGFIIGIMSIVPIPVYSQVPAGYAFKSNLMDYYFPEFGKIGMQPIYNYHVTPLQISPTQLNDVFGYQRPWWDLISSVDEAHGEFRSSANGYLIHRQFAEAPVLNGNFLKIDNKYINDVFAITDTEISDQFQGVLNFHVTKKTSIPLHGEPSIE